MWITSSLKAAKAPVHIALGNFDGVHLGHQRVMAQILSEQAAGNKLAGARTKLFTSESIETLHSGVVVSGYSHLPHTTWKEGYDTAARRTEADAQTVESSQSIGSSQSIESTDAECRVTRDEARAPALTTVVTFSPHPQEYFSGVAKPLLTPVAEKTWQLAQLGVQQLVMLPFDAAMAQLSPEAFVEQVLIEGLQAQRISVGSDFRFGKGRKGNAERLEAIAQKHGVPVIQVPLKYEQGDRISSSRIRTALESGHPEQAAQLLGRPYTLTGRVVQGKQLGRTIGFPTANLQVPGKKYLPRTGVYSVRVYGVEPEPLKGVMNIGNRPTVQGQDLSIEVHVLDWNGDLYGQLVTVSLEGFVRAEQKFDSLEQLKAQIAADCDIAIAALSASGTCY